MSSQRSRANRSIGGKINSLDSSVRDLSSRASTPAPGSVSQSAFQDASVPADALQAGSVNSPALGRGAVGTENLGVVNALSSDADLVLTVPGTIYIQPSTQGPATPLWPVGIVLPFAGYFPNDVEPYGWLQCVGALVSRVQYPALFAAIGVTYGAGNGSTTFQLPDLRNVFIGGATLSDPSSTAGVLGYPGARGGEANHTLTVAELPAHNHGLNRPANNIAATGSAIGAEFVTTAGTGTYENKVTQSTGSGTPHNNVPPYVAMSYLIRAY